MSSVPQPRNDPLGFGCQDGPGGGSGSEGEGGGAAADGGPKGPTLRSVALTLRGMGTRGLDIRKEIAKILEEEHYILNLNRVAFLAAYMATGVVAFSFVFEGWGVVDSLYFSMVTFTTVGYGDIAPETQWGRFFAIFYALSGIATIGVIIGKIGEHWVDRWVKTIEEMDRLVEDSKIHLINERTIEREADPSDPTEGKGLYKTIVRPHLPFFVPFIIGAYIEGKDQAWSFIDVLYYATCTLTTIGYGDLAPNDPVSRMVAVFFVPLSVFALASMLSKYADLSVERKVIKAHHSIVDRGLRLSDLHVMDKDGNGVVSRLEFIEFMLLSMDKVDNGFLDRLHQQFDILDKDGNGELDKRDLVRKIRRSICLTKVVDGIQPVETSMLLGA